MLQNATPLRKSALTSLLVPRLPWKMHLCKILFKCPTPANTFETATNPHALLTFDKVQNLLHRPRETTSEHPKVFRACGVCAFWLGNVLRATAAFTFSTSQIPKLSDVGLKHTCFFHASLHTSGLLRTWCALRNLTWKRASRHNGVRFFNISISKIVLSPSVFYTFHFQMCFAPQRRAIFLLWLFPPLLSYLSILSEV